jgi:CheY-like chemotaxis protein
MAFVVRMPTVEVDSPRADSPAARDTLVGSARSSRILVVDDNQDAARTLARLLRILGHETRTANDGGEAVEVAEEYRPELILLDIGLPILNGYDVARTIRDRPWGRDVAIVALTGWGQENDRLRSKEAGIDDHLVKPVDPEHLVRIVAGVRGETPRT